MAAVVLALPIAIVFGRAVGFGYVDWDDQIHVYQNPLLNPPTAATLLRTWSAPYLGFYIPVSYTAWWGIAGFARLDHPDAAGAMLVPMPFHLANLVGHFIAGVAVWLLIRQLIRARDEQQSPHPNPLPGYRKRGKIRSGKIRSAFEGLGVVPALAGACVFAIHPLAVEPVAWVTGLRDVLCGMFSALSLWLYVKAVDDMRGRPLRWELPASACFVLAMLSKPAAAPLPFMALATHLVGRRSLSSRNLVLLLGWCLLAVPFVLITRHAQGGKVIHVQPIGLRFPQALGVLSFYLAKLLLPLRLAIDYGPSARGPIALLLLLPAIAALAWKNRVVLAGMAIFVAALLPVLGLVPFAYQDISSVADRFAYLALIGAALMTAGAVERWPRIAIPALIPILLALGTLSFAQTGSWRDNATLADQELQVNSQSWVGHGLRAAALAKAGRAAQAIDEYTSALAIRHDDVPALVGRAAEYRLVNRPEAAAEDLRAALRFEPTNADAHYNYGNLLLSMNRPAEAIEQFQSALATRPGDLASLQNLGAALAMTGEFSQSAAVYGRLLQLEPGSAEVHANLARVWEVSGRPDDARAEYEAALRINPNLAQAQRGLTRLSR